jgi:hypothetical protein
MRVLPAVPLAGASYDDLKKSMDVQFSEYCFQTGNRLFQL